MRSRLINSVRLLRYQVLMKSYYVMCLLYWSIKIGMQVTSQSVTQESRTLNIYDVTTDNTTSDLYETNTRGEQSNQNKQSIPYIKILVISLQNNSRCLSVNL